MTEFLAGFDVVEQFDRGNQKSGTNCGDARVDIAVSVQDPNGRLRVHNAWKYLQMPQQVQQPGLEHLQFTRVDTACASGLGV